MIYLNRIIDANLNRISEGLRVIEEYTRFVLSNEELTHKFSKIRKQINFSEIDPINNLFSRDTQYDVRSKEPPQKRDSIFILLKANFKRVEEALRVLEEYTNNLLYNQLRYDIYDLEKEVLLNFCKKNINFGIYLISDSVDILENGLKNGVSLIQLRDKTATKNEFLRKARIIKEKTKKYQVPFIVNDFIDIALLVNADGFHSGQDDIPIHEQRVLLGPHKIIGRTTHNLEQGLIAEADGVDYISVGPIWDTPSKPGRPGIGFDYLKAAKDRIKIPYVAIGGINKENLGEILTFRPSLIGIIRAHDEIDEINRQLQL
ncbi:MAG: thiamine phosphate synthase [Candidatus Margulisiibacteriota bacterium]|jgi:thiamine-phosphate pyrophosphorylase